MNNPIPLMDLASLHREIAPELDEAWRKVTVSGRFVGGEFVDRFEGEWAAYCGVGHCVGVSDGTAALELALRALGIGPGDEVIVPANTFIATFEAVVAAGADPVPVDVDPATLLINEAAVLGAATPRTAAVIAVHLYGQPADMDALGRVARRLGIAVIEDAAQAHGAGWRGRRAGSLGDIACFSFYPSKNLGGLGDGGAVVTDHADLAERVRALGNHGRDAAVADRHLVIGSNHRLDGIQAAVLSAKLPHLDRWNAARRQLAERYRSAFAGTVVVPPTIADSAISSHHLAVVQLPQRDAVRRSLAAAGVGTGIHYATACHHQPAFARLRTASLPVVERAAQRIVSLPLYPHLTMAEVDYVADAVLAAVHANVGHAPALPVAAAALPGMLAVARPAAAG